MSTIRLTPEQHEALTGNGNTPPRAVDPVTNKTYILMDEQTYERLKGLLLEGDVDPETMYPLLAELTPEDWEEASIYGLGGNQK